MVVHPPLGPIARFIAWAAAFLAMPGRIKMLAEARGADSDKRPVCTSCGQGRIGNLQAIPGESNYSAGTCDKCGIRFYVAANGSGLNGLYPPSR